MVIYKRVFNNDKIHTNSKESIVCHPSHMKYLPSSSVQFPFLPCHVSPSHVKYQLSFVVLHVIVSRSPRRVTERVGVDGKSGHPTTENINEGRSE